MKMSKAKASPAPLIPEHIPPESGKTIPENAPAIVSAMMFDIPEDTQLCYNLIGTTIRTASVRFALYMWSVGRLIDALLKKGEKESAIYERVGVETQYKPRNLKYCLSAFRNIPDPMQLYRMTDHAEWTDIRRILGIKNSDTRQKLCEKIATGSILPEQFPATVKELKEKESGKSAAGAKPKERKVKETEKPDPKAVFGQFEAAATESLKTLLMHAADCQSMITYLYDENVVSEAEFNKEIVYFERAEKAMSELLTKMKTRMVELGKYANEGPKKPVKETASVLEKPA